MTKPTFAPAVERRMTIRATKMLAAGASRVKICAALGCSNKWLWERVKSLPRTKPAEVDYDPRLGCWRIYIYDVRPTGEHSDAQAGIRWWPLGWLTFATEEAALEHLEIHGEHRSVA